MIREGGRYTGVADTRSANLLEGTQFSTITEPTMFTVRVVATSTAVATVEFRIDSIVLTREAASVQAGGIYACETEPVVFQGMVDPGNLFLYINNGTGTPVYYWDITAE